MDLTTTERVEKIICVKRVVPNPDDEAHPYQRIFEPLDVSDLFLHLLTDSWNAQIFQAHLADFWSPTHTAVDEDPRHFVEIHLSATFILGIANEEELKAFMSDKMQPGSRFLSIERTTGDTASFAYLEMGTPTLHDPTISLDELDLTEPPEVARGEVAYLNE
jgi:hypothetical protein